MEWWESDDWAGGRPMDYPDRRVGAKRQRLSLTTEPEMKRTKNGALRLILRNRHPHERLHVYVGR